MKCVKYVEKHDTNSTKDGGMGKWNYTTERLLPLEVIILSVKSVKWDRKSGKWKRGSVPN